jgi:hypothetical protein
VRANSNGRGRLQVEVVTFDKTGTLTKGNFLVVSFEVGRDRKTSRVTLRAEGGRVGKHTGVRLVPAAAQGLGSFQTAGGGAGRAIASTGCKVAAHSYSKGRGRVGEVTGVIGANAGPGQGAPRPHAAACPRTSPSIRPGPRAAQHSPPLPLPGRRDGRTRVAIPQPLDGWSRHDLLRLLGSLERGSSHPLAAAILGYAAAQVRSRGRLSADSGRGVG